MRPGSGETIDVENVWVLGTWTLVLNALPLTNNYGLLLCLEIEMILYQIRSVAQSSFENRAKNLVVLIKHSM